MNKNKQMKREEQEKRTVYQLKILGMIMVLIFAGLVFRELSGKIFNVLKLSCFAGVAGLFIWLKIYNGRHKQDE